MFYNIIFLEERNLYPHNNRIMYTQERAGPQIVYNEALAKLKEENAEFHKEIIQLKSSTWIRT